jgi:hypothetical protein
MNLYSVKMAGVFMISSSTLAIRTGFAAHHERKDLALGQAFVASAPLPLLSPRLLLGGTPDQCPLHCFDQFIPPHRLSQEIR